MIDSFYLLALLFKRNSSMLKHHVRNDDYEECSLSLSRARALELKQIWMLCL